MFDPQRISGIVAWMGILTLLAVQPASSHKQPVHQYIAREGYQALEKALKAMTPEGIIEEVKKSNLRGRGGAGFPAGMKWSFVPKDSPKPKYIIANADESEPGTCKDRPLMEFDPHQLIEGMIIAGRSVNSHQGYIYVRGEYRYVLDIVDEAIHEAYAHGFLGKSGGSCRFAFLTLVAAAGSSALITGWRTGDRTRCRAFSSWSPTVDPVLTAVSCTSLPPTGCCR